MVETVNSVGAASPLPGGLQVPDHVLRIASWTVLIVWVLFWLWRTSGSLDIGASALLIGLVSIYVGFGRWICARWLPRFPRDPGIALDVVLGFFVSNTLLFLLMVVAPWGMGINLLLVGVLAALSLFDRPARSLSRTADGEWGSLVCIVVSGALATLWVQDQQPIVELAGDRAIFKAWHDLYIHAREISAFAQSHGWASLSDIKLAGIHLPPYHYAGYMPPAALNAVSDVDSLVAYGAFQLPFGILLVGLSVYLLASVSTAVTWPAVLAAAVVLGAPDAHQQGMNTRILSYHFMTQVNLGMLYGLACICACWILMIVACRQGRWHLLALAYVFFAITAFYKAHLFIANGFLVLIFPCLFFGRLKPGRRLLLIGVACALFGAAVLIGLQIPRAPTYWFDGSGIGPYMQILRGTLDPGRLTDVLVGAYDASKSRSAMRGVLAAAFIVVASFAWWLPALLAALWLRWRREPRPVLVFVLLVFFNYLAMAILLAADRTGWRSDELMNRPHAWAYLVVVGFSTVWLVRAFLERWQPGGAARTGFAAALVVALFASAAHFAPNLQTYPAWSDHTSYLSFNSVPACEHRAAEFIRRQAEPSAVMQDSMLDPKLRSTAVAERQAYVIASNFGGNVEESESRAASLRQAQASGRLDVLVNWARERGVRWYLAHPGQLLVDPSGTPAEASFRCGDHAVYDLQRSHGR